MNFLGETTSLVWLASMVLKSTLWLFVLLGLSFTLCSVPTFKHRFLLGGLLGIGLLPLSKTCLPLSQHAVFELALISSFIHSTMCLFEELATFRNCERGFLVRCI